MVVVVDTCSLHRLVEYYLPLDKSNKLVPLMESLFMSHDIVMTKAIYDECAHMSKGIILEKLPFLKSKDFKPLIVKEDTFIPDNKLMTILNDHFTIREKFKSLPPEQQEAQKEIYLQGGDFSLLTCAYMKKKGMAEELFGDDLRVLTDETPADNDNKCFKKIPICCKILDTNVISIREFLEYATEGKIELIIN